jgi:hypothetical protein
MSTTTTRKPQSFTVTKQNTTVTVYPYRSGWRFAWKDTHDGDKWKYVTRRTKDEAKAAALEKLEEISWGKLAWSALPHERRRFLTVIHDATHPDDEQRVKDFAANLRRDRDLRAAAPDPSAPPA